MSVVLVLIATGPEYRQFAGPLLESAERFLVPHQTLLFTDAPKDFRGWRVRAADLGYPMTTLLRYHLILSESVALARFDHIFYCDIDMLFVDAVSEAEILSDGITATLHPGWIHRPHAAQFEERPESAAHVDVRSLSHNGLHYYCGGFVGGSSPAFLAMAEQIRRQVECDVKKGLIARWHDESHLNRYLCDHPPARSLSPSFCYPPETRRAYYRGIWQGRDYEPKLMCLEKPWRR